ncbi:MAG: hypothetical protein JST16_12910 [Bdellovibrionales bacterium]|nr:hypothetical protein [Bdellovibrionales bacterium]
MTTALNKATIYGLVLSAFVPMFARGADQLPPGRAAELFCKIREKASVLDCQYFDGAKKRTLTDQDIIDFVDHASVDAYLTLVSRKGLERTLRIDPGYANFKKLSEVQKVGSASEIARTKFELFTEIERRVVKISDELDSALAQQFLIKFDPYITNEKYRRELQVITNEAIHGVESAAGSCATENQLATIAQDNRVLGAQLMALVNAFRSPDSCLSDYPMNVGADGSVDIEALKALPQAFSERCHKMAGSVAIAPPAIQSKELEVRAPASVDSAEKTNETESGMAKSRAQ